MRPIDVQRLILLGAYLADAKTRKEIDAEDFGDDELALVIATLTKAKNPEPLKEWLRRRGVNWNGANGKPIEVIGRAVKTTAALERALKVWKRDHKWWVRPHGQSIEKILEMLTSMMTPKQLAEARIEPPKKKGT